MGPEAGEYKIRDTISVRVSAYAGGGISVIYFIHGVISFSELELILLDDKNIINQDITLAFEEAAVLVDKLPFWIQNVTHIRFRDSTLFLNGHIFSNVKRLNYDVNNYDENFYMSFPNVENLQVRADGISDISFLYDLKFLTHFEIELLGRDTDILTRLFYQYYTFIKNGEHSLEGRVGFTTRYHYPNYDPDEDVFRYYAEPPDWYDGPDISGVPAWVLYNGEVMAAPSSGSEVIRHVTAGNFLLIKGRAEIYEERWVEQHALEFGYGEVPFSVPWENESQYRLEQEIAEKWIKVRFEDRMTGYIKGSFLSLRPPDQIIHGAADNSER
jgi:hypothetical protein